ncbi:hypothetical protein BH24ACT8_BH24ACT8_23530 [soil metagenome]
MDAHLTVLDTGHRLDRDDPHGWLNAVSNVAARARRVPRTPAEQAELGGDARWRYGAFVTNTATGQVQYLDARHARRRVLKIPTGWAWADDLARAWDRIAALHPT